MFNSDFIGGLPDYLSLSTDLLSICDQFFPNENMKDWFQANHEIYRWWQVQVFIGQEEIVRNVKSELFNIKISKNKKQL